MERWCITTLPNMAVGALELFYGYKYRKKSKHVSRSVYKTCFFNFTVVPSYIILLWTQEQQNKKITKLKEGNITRFFVKKEELLTW